MNFMNFILGELCVLYSVFTRQCGTHSVQCKFSIVSGGGDFGSLMMHDVQAIPS
jgi:hypothetical protein